MCHLPFRTVGSDAFNKGSAERTSREPRSDFDSWMELRAGSRNEPTFWTDGDLSTSYELQEEFSQLGQLHGFQQDAVS